MAAISDATQKKAIQDIIFRNCEPTFSRNELSYVVNEIIADPTEDTLNRMFAYLKDFRGIRFGDRVLEYDAVLGASLAKNAARAGLGEVSAYLKTLNQSAPINGSTLPIGGSTLPIGGSTLPIAGN